MKAVIVSDTHGTKNNADLELVLNKHRPDCVIHLGDRVGDIDEVMQKNFTVNYIYVKGNCDYYDPAPKELILNFGGFKTLICHGHEYGVKICCTRLLYSALEKNVHIVLFGHTHVPYKETVQDVLLINPGSFSGTHTYAVLTVKNGRADAVIESAEDL